MNLDLDTLIKCDHCKQIYDDPIILPCSTTICSKHLPISKIYQCISCNQEHVRPENGFPIDKKAIKLIEMKTCVKIEQINFGTNNERAKIELNNLEKLINEADPLTRDHLIYINDFFGELKHKIDLTREHYIKLINANHERIMNQVIECENECKSNAENKLLSTLNKSLQQTRNNLNQWKQSLKVPDFTKDSEWNTIRLAASKENEKTKNLMTKCRNHLLLNKKYNFIPKSVFNENNFGDLEIENLSDEHSEYLFDIKIKSFISFKDSTKILLQPFLIKKTLWNVIFRIADSIDIGRGLCLCVKPEDTLDPVKFKATFRIIQHKHDSQLKADLKKHFQIQLKENEECNSTNCVPLSEIMNETNGIYDPLNDLINLRFTFMLLPS